MTYSRPHRRIVVLGIGNTLLQDEGVGVHAMRQLQRECGEIAGVEFIDGGTLSFSLAGPIAQADGLIVLDAAEFQDSPGTTRLFVDEEMDRFLGENRKRSVHEVGLLDLMAVSCLTDSLPVQRALIGIQPQRMDWGDAPGDAVTAAIPVACAMARNLIEAWRRLPLAASKKEKRHA